MLTDLVRAGLRATAVVSPGLAGRLAFQLWRRPLMRGRVREVEREVHEAARIEIVDGVVTYAWGDGSRPVLLVHGWRSRASRYYALVARLLELGYSPVSYDAPGHGDTPGPTGTILDHQRIIRGLEAKHGPFEGVIAYSLGMLFGLYAVQQGVAAKWIVTISGIAQFDYLVDKFCRELRLGPAVRPRPPPHRQRYRRHRGGSHLPDRRRPYCLVGVRDSSVGPVESRIMSCTGSTRDDSAERAA